MNVKEKLNIKLKKNQAEKSSEIKGVELQIQHRGGNRPLSVEGIYLDFNLK